MKHLLFSIIVLLFALPAVAQDRPDFLVIPSIGADSSDDGGTGLLSEISSFGNLKNKHWLGFRVSFVSDSSRDQTELAVVYRLMSYEAPIVAPFFEVGLGVALEDQETGPLFTIGGGVVVGGSSRVRGEVRFNLRASGYDERYEEVQTAHGSFSAGVVIGL